MEQSNRKQASDRRSKIRYILFIIISLLYVIALFYHFSFVIIRLLIFRCYYHYCQKLPCALQAVIFVLFKSHKNRKFSLDTNRKMGKSKIKSKFVSEFFALEEATKATHKI